MATSIRLDDETNKRLDSLAKDTGRSKSFYIRKLIEDGLDKIEYEYRILNDLENYRKGKLETYTLEEMIERYGLED